MGIIEAVCQLDLGTSTPLQVRIGIATGLVVVGDVLSDGLAQEHSVVGETPNLASRLQAVAEPNTVVIDSNTHRLLGEQSGQPAAQGILELGEGVAGRDARQRGSVGGVAAG